ncbi:MAG: hypothetical protein KAJ51_04560 [Thermoplasmata archaeon]|nr:hypothetical protein [Thermoplasmata archaeon]
MQNAPTLIFVYNAESGFVNMLEDYLHKEIKPSTYQCNLCAVTYGSLGMRRDWKNFINGLDVPTEFLHRDEFYEKYKLKDFQFPAAFLKKGSEIELFITHEEINNCKSLDELIELVTIKVNGITPHV